MGNENVRKAEFSNMRGFRWKFYIDFFFQICMSIDLLMDWIQEKWKNVDDLIYLRIRKRNNKIKLVEKIKNYSLILFCM